MLVLDELHFHVGHIRGLASNLRRHDVVWDADARSRCAEQIESEVQRIRRLLDELLASTTHYSRHRAEHPGVPVSPAILVSGGVDRVRASLSGRRVEIDVPAELPWVELDAPAIEQVIAALVQDAVVCTPASCRIKLSAEVRGDFLRLCMEDEGSWQLPQGREHLAMCQAIVEAQGGCIWTDPRRTGSQCLVITLPMRGRKAHV